MRADRMSDPAIVKEFKELALEFPVYAPMLAMVTRLCAKPYADKVPAYISFGQLFIRWEGSECTGISYDTGIQMFLVTYTARKSATIKHWCDVIGAENLFDSFVLRLLMTYRSKTGSDDWKHTQF